MENYTRSEWRTSSDTLEEEFERLKAEDEENQRQLEENEIRIEKLRAEKVVNIFPTRLECSFLK
jgi:hypothetical protein